MSIRFRKSVTFNRHDSKLVRRGDRIEVSLGLKKRCELTLLAVLRFGAEGVSTQDLTDHLNGRFKNAYSESDVSSACTKLARGGFVTRRGHGSTAMVRATKNALEKWRKTEKISV
jgi:hypothetical protein